jgi:hypothetical protein
MTGVLLLLKETAVKQEFHRSYKKMLLPGLTAALKKHRSLKVTVGAL